MEVAAQRRGRGSNPPDGQVPDWWQGRRWNRPVRAWAGSETWDVNRDAVQRLLVGEPKDQSQWGMGLIPGGTLVDWASRQGARRRPAPWRYGRHHRHDQAHHAHGDHRPASARHRSIGRSAGLGRPWSGERRTIGPLHRTQLRPRTNQPLKHQPTMRPGGISNEKRHPGQLMWAAVACMREVHPVLDRAAAR
jgi:hypothetical protein